MPKPLLFKTAKVIKRFFYIFLDISGILLGVFLIVLGLWTLYGKPVSKGVGFLILFLGVAAFLIHFGHYFSLKITKWIFGSDDYFITRKGGEDKT